MVIIMNMWRHPYHLIRLAISPYLAWTILGLIISINAAGQTAERDKVIVSYTYNFAKNIRWPNEDRLTEFTIGLYQVNDQELIDEFYKLHNRAQLKSVPVRVSLVRNMSSLGNYNLIYTQSTDGTLLGRAQSLLEGKPTLLVTKEFANKRLVMINLFNTSNQSLQFEVNKANLLNNNLTPLPELILLGGTEIDVARLYREGQTSLVNLQKQLAGQQQRLTNLQSNIADQEKTNSRLVGQMLKLNKDIKELRDTNENLGNELKQLQAEIQQSKNTIAQQKQDIARSEAQKQQLIQQVQQRNQELDEKQAQLLIRQKELDAISQTISNKEKELTRLNQTIASQEEQLQIQKNSIKELDELVNAQKTSLYYLYGLITLGTILFLFSLYAYKLKRNDNERLARHARELQIAGDKLEVAKRKAESANRAKSAFLSLMTHELRTPLQSIIGYSDLMIEDMKNDCNDYYIDQLSRVHSNGERLLELINNTLDLAKIESGKMQVTLTPSQMSTIIDEASSSVKPLMQQHHNEFIVNIDDDQHLTDIDYEKMVHIMINLISNANKFTQNGSITIDIKNQPHHLQVAVKDTGAGMTQEQLNVIFGKFQQAAQHRKAGLIKGTGLGLSITRHFCELMGGTIRVESEVGKGSSFIVDIPLPVVITEKPFLLDDDSE